MYSRIDDLLALIGFACILAGVYLLLGLPATLILFGGVLVFVGVRLEIRLACGGPRDEPD